MQVIIEEKEYLELKEKEKVLNLIERKDVFGWVRSLKSNFSQTEMLSIFNETEVISRLREELEHHRNEHFKVADELYKLKSAKQKRDWW